jgi:SAM-dependent methyltransferase
VRSAAEHFVPRARDPSRHERLVVHLRDVLWKQDIIEVQQCSVCGFGFGVPWVGGDADFYAIAHEGRPHYPSHRWEFGVTLDALRYMRAPLRLAEVGAGNGAFLKLLGDEYYVTAADLDEGAVTQLRAQGFDAVRGSLSDLAGRADPPNDVVCMFQTLEHMADFEEVFEHLRRLLKPGGSLFLSVPNGAATDLQEVLTGLWDMPPNHIGRWTPAAIERLAERQRFGVAAIELEPVRTIATAWLYAVFTVNARAYDSSSLEGRVNAIASRPLRGAVKRACAIQHVPRLLSSRDRYRPISCWAHLVRRD